MHLNWSLAAATLNDQRILKESSEHSVKKNMFHL